MKGKMMIKGVCSAQDDLIQTILLVKTLRIQ